VDGDALAACGGNAGALLSAVLKGEETKEGQSAGGLLRGIHGDNPALLAGVVERAIVLMGARLTVHGGILFTPSPAVNHRGNLFEALPDTAGPPCRESLKPPG
jgi:hypothetical protein